MTTPYLKICKQSRDELEAAARQRARRAFRVMLFAIGAAVFGAVCLVAGLAARGESSGAMRLPVDRVGFVEINRVYGDNGKCTLEQVCFADWWEFNLDDSRFLYRAWRLYRCPTQIPVRDYQRGGYVAIWLDGDQLRVVRSDTVIETHLEHDPELRQRAICPVENRRELFRAGK